MEDRLQSSTQQLPDFAQLKDNFIWGAATSAIQIEGALNEDGRGSSIWDEFSHKKGKIRFGHVPDVACDHYHRYRDDVKLMQQLNLQAYRFSIAWPRILPEGRGKINQAGLDFYKRLTDELLHAGIRPFATLFHWDLPQALYRSHKGFLHRDMANIFADYVDVVVSSLGDRIKDWITLNEPFEHAALGHIVGSHAPGKHSMSAFLKVIHHQLLGHGAAVERIRGLSPDARVGITVSLTPVLPSSDSDKDRWAAQFGNQILNRITLHPLYKGQYPQELQQRLRWFWPKVKDGDLERIGQPCDFLGINHYSHEYATYKSYVPFLNCWISGANIAEAESEHDGKRYTSMGWEVNPQGMNEVLRLVREEYGNPNVFITENGAAFDDKLVDSRVTDTKRIDYFQDYLAEVNSARIKGSNLCGYFAWSLMDNFEWAVGYSKRFGLIHVDYESQRRTIKDSGHWYAQLIKKHSDKSNSNIELK